MQPVFKHAQWNKFNQASDITVTVTAAAAGVQIWELLLVEHDPHSQGKRVDALVEFLLWNMLDLTMDSWLHLPGCVEYTSWQMRFPKLEQPKVN